MPSSSEGSPVPDIGRPKTFQETWPTICVDNRSRCRLYLLAEMLSPRPWVDGRKVGKMGEGLSASGPGSPTGASREAETVVPRHEPVTRPWLGNAAGLPS